jgi:hypothetical protein
MVSRFGSFILLLLFFLPSLLLPLELCLGLQQSRFRRFCSPLQGVQLRLVGPHVFLEGWKLGFGLFQLFLVALCADGLCFVTRISIVSGVFVEDDEEN